MEDNRQFQRAKEIIQFLAKDPDEKQCEMFMIKQLDQNPLFKPNHKTFRILLTQQAAMLMEMVDKTWRGFRDG